MPSPTPTRQILRGARSIVGEPITVVIGADGLIESVGPSGPDDDSPDDDSPDDSSKVTIDLSGHVLAPAPVEPHAHLDKAFLSEVIENPTGDLIGAVMAMRANRHLLGVDETAERAERAARWMAANGYVAVRTHVDLTVEHGLTSVEALQRVKQAVADVIDVEIVALSGWPIVGAAGADQRALTRDAIGLGIDVFGGCPHLEHSHGDGDVVSATDVMLEMAAEAGLPVDLHTDETLDPTVAGLDHLARQVLDGFPHPVTASHCVSLGVQDATTRAATIDRVAEAGVSVVTLPHTNLFLQGRGSDPMPRGLTAVDELQRAGVRVAAGADNLQDPFNPVGRACPFETAGLMIMTAHRLPADAGEMVSTLSARVLGRNGAIEAGAVADLLAVEAGSIREAIARGDAPRRRWRGGQEITDGAAIDT
ncbi:MAG: amidohydrolase family protein [Actinomycetota bacterium]